MNASDQSAYVIAPVLDWLFISQQKSRAIAQLLSRGDFRIAAVHFGIRVTLIALAVLCATAALMLMIFGSAALLMIAVLTISFLLLFYYYRNVAYRLSLNGVFTTGKVETVGMEYLRTPGQFVSYTFHDQNGILREGKRFCPFFLKSLNMKPGDEISVFYDPESPGRSEVFKSGYLYEPCISQNKFCALSNMKDMGEYPQKS